MSNNKSVTIDVDTLKALIAKNRELLDARTKQNMVASYINNQPKCLDDNHSGFKGACIKGARSLQRGAKAMEHGSYKIYVSAGILAERAMLSNLDMKIKYAESVQNLAEVDKGPLTDEQLTELKNLLEE